MVDPSHPDTILSWPQVQGRIGNISRTTVWRAIRRQEFPSSVRISRNRVGWREADLQSWLANRPTVVSQ